MSRPPSEIDEILDLLDKVCDPGFELCHWHESEKRDIDGKTVYTMPYPSYSPQVDKFFELVFQVCTPLDPYARLPEDPPDKEPVQVLSAPEDMVLATQAQICRFLIHCRRGERFCDGYIEQQFRSGMIRAAAERLKSLADGSEGTGTETG